MNMTIYPAEGAAEVAAASDGVWANQPRERRPVSSYVLMSVPFDVPPNSLVSVTISESDSAERMAASVYPLILAGATVNVVPLSEVPVTDGVKGKRNIGVDELSS